MSFGGKRVLRMPSGSDIAATLVVYGPLIGIDDLV